MSEFKGLLSKGEDLKKMVDEAISKLRTEKYKESAEMLHKLESETRDLRNQILAIESRESQSPDYDMEGMVKQQGHGMKIAVTNTVENFMMDKDKKKQSDIGTSSASIAIVKSLKRKLSSDIEITDDCKRSGKWYCPHPECKVSFPFKSKLERHFNAVHLKLRRFKCSKCDKAFNEESQLKVHVQSIHENQKEICDVCGLELSCKPGLINHKKRVHGDMVNHYGCPECEQKFSRQRYVKVHVKLVHQGKKEFTCDICQGAYQKKNTLDYHIRSIHNKEKRFKCNDCEMTFFFISTYKRHTATRECKICLDSSNCFNKFSQHRSKHELECQQCKKVLFSTSQAQCHCNTHLKPFKCNVFFCKSSFATVYALRNHLIAVHKYAKCCKCKEMIQGAEQLKKHYETYHQKSHCLLCDDKHAFAYYDPKDLSGHIANAHQNIFHCAACGLTSKDSVSLLGHACKKVFNEDLVKVFTSLSTIDLDGVISQNHKSVLADDNGLISEIIPGFPFQATCSISEKRNKTDKQNFDKNLPVYINQSQQLIQNGTSAILSWCLEINALSSCTEIFEWQRNSSGGILRKPKFSRRQIQFKKDENDVLFKIRSTKLTPPWQLGHARAAGNCWNEIDYKASFSNLNYWAMHEVLNTNFWRVLEENIRVEAKKFKRAFITTGAIFMKNGKMKANYVCGVIIPERFYKVVFYEGMDGKFVLKCWIMENSEKVQPLNTCEVSVLQVEAMTRCWFLHPDVMKKLDKESINRHLNQLK